MSRQQHQDDYFVCPHCGAELPAGAKFCRQCGASDESGWNEGDAGENGDLAAEDDFDYQDFLRREFPDQAEPSPKEGSKRLGLWIVVGGLCAAFLYWAFFRFGE
jgi:hypothetical protein